MLQEINLIFWTKDLRWFDGPFPAHRLFFRLPSSGFLKGHRPGVQMALFKMACTANGACCILKTTLFDYFAAYANAIFRAPECSRFTRQVHRSNASRITVYDQTGILVCSAHCILRKKVQMSTRKAFAGSGGCLLIVLFYDLHARVVK